MPILTSLTLGLRRLVNPLAAERDLDDEVKGFLAESIAEKMREGLSREDATRRARIELGGVTAVKQQVREGAWEATLESFWQDVSYGARALRRNPGFTTVAVLTLGLGIGVNSAMFSVVNAVILRPLPFVNPSQLVMLWTNDVKSSNREAGTGIPTIADWRADTADFSDVAIYRRNSAIVTSPGESERVKTVFAEPRLFPLLGVKPALGRTFTDAENAGGELVAVISDQLWKRRFASGDVIGKSIAIDGDLTAWKNDPRVVRIVGVMPPAFYFPDKTVDVWEPIRSYFRYDHEAEDRYDYSSYIAIARVRPGSTVNHAQKALTTISTRLEALYPSPARNFPGYVPNVVSVLDEVAGQDLQRALWVLLGAVVFVMLIACVNVANLLLARGATREREFAIRLAVGAGRARILRQLLVESLLLALVACAFGLLLAYGAVRVLVAAAPSRIPRVDELSLDGSVLLFTLGLSVVAALAFGLAPAWRAATTPPHESIKSESGAATSARRVARLRGALVIAECALAVVLLSGAGLLMRSFLYVQAVDPGFSTENVLLVRFSPTPSIGANLRGAAQRFDAQEQILHSTLERVRALPGVVSAGFSGELMMSTEPDESITFDGDAYDANAHRNVQLKSIGVTPGFFDVMRVPLKKGRTLTRDDGLMKNKLLFTSMTPSYTGIAEATLVNETFVKQLLGGRDPLGTRFWMGHPGKPYWYEIVGVVGDMRRQGLERNAVAEYFESQAGGSGDLVVRTLGNPLSLAAAVRSAMHDVDPGVAIVSITTAEAQLGAFSAERKFQAWLLMIFAAVALALAAIGIYGVMRYAVAQRMREIGIRVALGASSGRIERMVLSQGLLQTGIGIAVGIAGSLALTGVISHWLFGISATDPITYGAVAALLIAVATVACWLPARKAARVNPVVALRLE